MAEADGIAFEAQVVFDADSKHRLPTVGTPVELEEASNGEPFEIGDIQFATNSAEINRTSLLMLDLFAAYFLRNDAIGVHIKGHTDDRGRRRTTKCFQKIARHAWHQLWSNCVPPAASPTLALDNPNLWPAMPPLRGVLKTAARSLKFGSPTDFSFANFIARPLLYRVDGLCDIL